MKRIPLSRRVLALVSIGALIVLGIAAGGSGPLRYLYAYTLAPIAHGLADIGSSSANFFHELGQVDNLARQNATLTLQNASLRQRLAADAETRRDNQLLRQELGLKVATTPKEVAAEVTAIEPDSYRQFITVSVGKRDGIAPGQAVMSQGVLAGLVASVSATSAKVMLVTDPQFRLAATDQDASADGLLQGQLGGGLQLQQLDRSKTVKPGDTVTSAGLGGLIPAGLLIGQIQSVDTQGSDIFQTAEVSTTIKSGQIRFVMIVTP